MTSHHPRTTTNFNLAEPDEQFRKRILARVNPEHTSTIYVVQIAIGGGLDVLGRGYGLTRDGGPIINGTAGNFQRHGW
jgi:hypothetical protein